MMSEEDVNFPKELDAFLEKFGVHWIHASEITAQRWNGIKQAFRLTLAGGQILKARLLPPGLSSADIVASLKGGGAARRCGRVLHGEGRCLLEEWVDGMPLKNILPTKPDLLAECGRALAEIHQTACPDRNMTTQRRWGGGVEQLQHDLGVLCSHGHMTSVEMAKLFRIAEVAAPADSLYGLVHLDYHAKNIILHAQRGPICIDNETMRTGPFALDVARSIVLWPLSVSDRQIFLAAYSAAGGPAELTDLAFWSLIAEAWSARISIEYGNPAASHSLKRLRKQLHLISSDEMVMREPT